MEMVERERILRGAQVRAPQDDESNSTAQQN
jgi:hypothetical protein